MGYLIMAGQLILSLSILIVLHEMGHFLPARWFKTRVEKFYLFFDPWFSLFKKKIGETEYGIGWLPLGGYVKIAGMVDESFDTKKLSEAPQPWEFRSKKAWQRLIIMLGGVTVNFILGFLLFSMVAFIWGEKYLPASEAKNGIHVDSLGMSLGLQNGDQILKVGDKPFERFNDRTVTREIAIYNARTLVIRRNGEEKTIRVNEDAARDLVSYKNKDAALFVPRLPFKLAEIVQGGGAKEANLQPGDLIIGVNGEYFQFFDQFQALAKMYKGQKTNVAIVRGTDTLQIPVAFNEDGKIGAKPAGPGDFYNLSTQHFSFLESFPQGWHMGSQLISDQLNAFGQMFKGKIKASESLGGFGTLASMFGTTWEWEKFWRLTAVLSLILAIMNLLPIPALDGGHVLFLLYEMISGRKPSDKFLEYATMVGFALVLGLILYANGLDLFRGLFGK